MTTEPSSHSHPESGGTYTPGYAGAKLTMTLVGIAVLIFGFTQVWKPLHLLLWGEQANVEALYVIKSKLGLPDVVLDTDVEIQAQREPRDRSYIFWNVFGLHRTDGSLIEIRCNIASRVQPLFPLIDGDGLPTIQWVCLNPKNPQDAIFPMLISTWLAPVMICLVGLVTTLIGAVLLYWAKRPIEVPYIPSAEEVEAIAPEPKS